MAFDHLELVILDDFEKVFDESIKDFLRFNYEKMKNKYGWAWNWEICKGTKYLLPY